MSNLFESFTALLITYPPLAAFRFVFRRRSRILLQILAQIIIVDESTLQYRYIATK